MFFPTRYRNVIFSLLMSWLMSGIMSFIITVYNIGLVDTILSIWLKSWGFAFIVAFPTVLVVSPIVRRLTQFLIKSN